MQWRIIPRTGRGSDKRGNNRVLEFVVEEVGVVLAARRQPDGGPAVPMGHPVAPSVYLTIHHVRGFSSAAVSYDPLWRKSLLLGVTAGNRTRQTCQPPFQRI